MCVMKRMMGFSFPHKTLQRLGSESYICQNCVPPVEYSLQFGLRKYSLEHEGETRRDKIGDTQGREKDGEVGKEGITNVLGCLCRTIQITKTKVLRATSSTTVLWALSRNNSTYSVFTLKVQVNAGTGYGGLR
jgi:hypothetical protein